MDEQGIKLWKQKHLDWFNELQDEDKFLIISLGNRQIADTTINNSTCQMRRVFEDFYLKVVEPCDAIRNEHSQPKPNFVPVMVEIRHIEQDE